MKQHEGVASYMFQLLISNNSASVHNFSWCLLVCILSVQWHISFCSISSILFYT